MPPTNPDSLLLKAWRTRTRRSQSEAAADLGIELDQLTAFELGDPVPRAILLTTRALKHRLEPLTADIDGARSRWVDLVGDVMTFGRGEPVIRRLLLEPDRGRLRRFLDFIVVALRVRLR